MGWIIGIIAAVWVVAWLYGWWTLRAIVEKMDRAWGTRSSRRR